MCRISSYKVLLFYAMAIMRCVTTCYPLQAQQKTDSLFTELKKASSGEKKLDILTALFWQSNGVDNYKSKEYAEQALLIANELNTNTAIAKASFINGVAQESGGDFIKAGTHFNRYLEYARAAGDTSLIAGALNSLGILNHKLANYQEALSYFMQRLEYLKADEHGALATNFNNIGLIHEAIDNNDKALEFFGKAIELHRLTSNENMVGGTLSNMGVIRFKMKEYDAALQLYNESIAVMQKLGNKNVLSILFENTGNVYKETGAYDLAIKSYRNSLALSHELADEYGIASVNGNLGEVYALAGKYQQAIEYLLTCRMQSLKIGAKSLVLNADRHLAKTYAAIFNYRKAYQFQQSYQELHDSLFNESKNKQIQELQTRYETEKKNSEIEILNADNQVKAAALQKEKIIRNVSVGGLLLIAFVAFMVVQNIRQKNKINRQRIIQLEKDRKLELLDVMMRTEEKERTRVARDLHDGLSGMLAATRMQFEHIKEDRDRISETNRIDTAISTLDKASIEVRRIAHNLIPEILMRFGLMEALTDFFEGIQSSHQLQINFQKTGIPIPLEQKVELAIYRVIQELLNNIIKHSGATDVLVELAFTPGWLSVTVEDNGKGISDEAMLVGKGIGLNNIKSRIQYLGGEISFHTAASKGTSVYIELPLDPLKSCES